MPTRVKLIVGLFVALVVLIVLVIINPFVIVGAGERGIVTNWGAVSNDILVEGIHWITPIKQDVKRVNVQTKTISFDASDSNANGTEMSAASKDLQDVFISVVVNYHPDVSKVNIIYQTYKEDYEASQLEPIVRNIVKNVSAGYTAEELVTKRTEFSDKVYVQMHQEFSTKYAILESVNIVNFKFSESFNKAIEQKVTAEQDALASKNKLEQVKFEAQQQIEQAKAEAESIRIQAQAVTQQGGKDYVQLRAIEKWNGELPNQFIPGSAMPFLNLNN